MNEQQEHEFNVEMARRLRERTREQQEQHIEQFVQAFSDAVEPFKNRSRWWWYRVIAIEWCRQRIEAVKRFQW